MIDHFQVLVEEGNWRIERVNLDHSKVSRWYPRALRLQDHHDNATLNVADQDKKKNYVQALELTFDLHWLLQVGDHSANFADSHEFHQPEA